MTFIYEPDPYSLEQYCMCKRKLPTSSHSKVIVWQTDRQTDTTEIIYHAASRVVKILSWIQIKYVIACNGTALQTFAKEQKKSLESSGVLVIKNDVDMG